MITVIPLNYHYQNQILRKTHYRYHQFARICLQQKNNGYIGPGHEVDIDRVIPLLFSKHLKDLLHLPEGSNHLVLWATKLLFASKVVLKKLKR